MKRRFADARSNRSIIKSAIETKEVDDEFFKGYISLLQIHKTKKEWHVDPEERCILADNYKWLELYPIDKHVCITAMMNKNNDIKEWYIDIAKDTGIIDGVPYEDDLYLDIVIVPDGRVHLLDEDELYKALEKGDISREEYDLAYIVANEILDRLPKDIDKLTKYTYEYLKMFE
jgi:hypothetical protein